MKKIIALVLAIIMMASMSVMIFAADDSGVATAPSVNVDDTTNANQSKPTVVTYKPTLGYEVIIPGDIELIENETTVGDETTYYGRGQGPVAINKAKIPAGSSIYVEVDSANEITNDNYNWLLKGEGTKSQGLEIKYNLSLTGMTSTTTLHSTTNADKLAQGSIVLFYTSAGGFKAQSATMVFETEKIVQAGDFKDTLTFSVSVEATR